MPSFGKMSNDQDDKNTKSISNMTSDYRHARQGTTSSAAGSDMMNFSDHKFAHETNSRVKTTKKKSMPIDAESLGDSVTDIPNQNTDLK